MFDDPPTSELWPVLEAGAVAYEHVLGEAGEDTSEPSVLTACRRLRATHGAGYYSALLFVLTHQRFPRDTAQGVWIRILCHRDYLTARLKRSPGIAVAALDYLTNIDGALTRPILIDEHRLSRLIDSATRDALTGLSDRGTLRLSLKHALRARATPLSLLMMDLDHFKEFNDRHGHLAGDRILTGISALLRDSIRSTDVAARFGGDEFCVVLPRRDLEEAVQIAERLRDLVERTFDSEGITASFGVASSLVRRNEKPDTLLSNADSALYVSKRNGGNRVSSYESASA